ncbi:MAG: DUF2284 domain-containing protein [Acholeplasmatales bacterium]
MASNVIIKYMRKIIFYLDKNKMAYKTTTIENIVFDESLIKYCEKNICGLYKKTWVCSPEARNHYKLDRIKNSKEIIIFSRIYKLKDPSNADEEIKDFKALLKRFKKLTSKNDLLFGIGGCEICGVCTYPNNACRYPNKTIFPLSIIGIDVLKTATKNKLKYDNGPNTTTLFGMLFINVK